MHGNCGNVFDSYSHVLEQKCATSQHIPARYYNDIGAPHGSFAVSKINTLNICVSHLPFPKRFDHYVDLMVSPVPMSGPRRVIQVADDFFGERGHTLSEYAQLLWLHDKLETLIDGFEYIRLFQYRRFVSSTPLGVASWNCAWTWIQPSRLRNIPNEFGRFSEGELFNHAIVLENGVVFQYAMSHILEDLLNFTKFIIENRIITPAEAVEFLTSSTLIPACSTGIYSVVNFKDIFGKLRQAAEFVNSAYYVSRPGIQRRVGGFLLERLNSYLLLRYLKGGSEIRRFGQYIMIEDRRILKRLERRIFAFVYRAAIKIGEIAQRHVAGVRIGSRVKEVLIEI